MLDNRRFVIAAIVVSIGIIFALRLFYLQVIDDSWTREAANMSERKVTVYPSRGLIFDRKHRLMVANIAVYDLMVVPNEVKNMDTAKFCDLVGISVEQYIERMQKAKIFSVRKPSVFEKQIPADQFSAISEQLHKFKGFYAQSRTLRAYPQSIASHTLGYIGEVNQRIIDKDTYYSPGDYYGASGLEKTYEDVLRGRKGVRYVVVDVYNNEKGRYKDGQYDTIALSGSDLVSTIDAELQAYGERLMQNKRGAIAAIDPSTGEVLALVNNPSYDPNLLTGRIRNQNFQALSVDTLKPLFNRAMQARYPPGSTFKLINALIGLQEGTLTPDMRYGCSMGYFYANRKLGCHSHGSPLDLFNAITTSCNAYFCNVFKNVIDKYPSTAQGYAAWRRHVTSFGLGDKTGIEQPNEIKGLVPTNGYYDKIHGKNRWKAHTVISLAIGQGELGVTPIQMANFVSIIANRGWYYRPHLVREIEGAQQLDRKFLEKQYTTIEPTHYDIVVEAMHNVVVNGTGRGAQWDPAVEVCGKTGTAQNPHGKDHSIFIAFAPKDNPKIAIAVYVENVGFGATWAAPISSLMMEKYLTGKITRPEVEKRMVDANLMKLLPE
ncbi:MAG TPA: penicillin-binding protein 2 [Luteibaculaceae bacterium]|nr:penicillin-binding protein 2 [Luteibaculaceae bacterium]